MIKKISAKKLANVTFKRERKREYTSFLTFGCDLQSSPSTSNATLFVLLCRIVDGQSLYNVNKNLIIDSNLVGESSGESFSRQKVRLRGVDRKFAAGRLEIYFDGKWNLVCEKFFTLADADVACAWLGFHK
uniref:SRCR domain-containing protein n=1 Tax=Romanomermis culicivorax TaxID=13658 RepID=A0A915IRR6_ROMCU